MPASDEVQDYITVCKLAFARSDGGAGFVGEVKRSRGQMALTKG
jgi:hypothetical protein